MNISFGTKLRAQRLVIYGPGGIGKTTLAASMPYPVFIDLEDGSAHMDVARFDPAPENWAALVDTVKQFRRENGGVYRSLIVDSLDVCERMVNEHVCKNNGWKSIEDAGYGKGYTRAAEAWGELLAALDTVIESGVNVILIGHATMRKQELPEETGAFDRWELQLRGKTLGNPTKSWADAVVFVNYKTTVVMSKTGAAKAKGGQRMAYASHRPTWDAKNRWGVPDSFPLDDAPEIIGKFMAGNDAPEPEPAPAPKPKPKPTIADAGGYVAPDWTQPRLQGLKEMCVERGITDTEIRQACADRKRATLDTPVEEYSDELVAFVISHFAQVEKVVHKIRERRAAVADIEIPFD